MGQSTPIEIAGHAYDAETVELLRTVLDQVWEQLTELQRNQSPRSLLAERLLRAAARGERDPDILRRWALDKFGATADLVRPDATPV